MWLKDIWPKISPWNSGARWIHMQPRSNNTMLDSRIHNGKFGLMAVNYRCNMYPLQGHNCPCMTWIAEHVYIYMTWSLIARHVLTMDSLNPYMHVHWYSWILSYILRCVKSVFRVSRVSRKKFPWSLGNKYRMSMEIVQGQNPRIKSRDKVHWYQGQSPCTPYTLSMDSLNTVDIVQFHREWNYLMDFLPLKVTTMDTWIQVPLQVMIMDS